MSNTLSLSNYELDLPGSNDSSLEASEILVDSLMSLPVGGSLDTPSGSVTRVSSNKFEVTVSDKQILDAVSTSTTKDEERGISREYW